MMLTQRYLFTAALFLTTVTYFANEYLGGMPEVKPETVASTEFSAERAITILENLLQEGIPHPVGSQANKRVKQKILQWLANEGIEAEVQSSWGCSKKWNTCAWVENIIATIPGKEDFPYLALMAHYDSVPPAPGAGDDGAGVATVLEIGRMLKNEGPFRNPILLLITDAEEKGLLGAEAFFAHHPMKEKVGVIVNVEGSGSSGPSQLLRTAMNNKTLIDAYGDGAEYPYGVSLASEIFKRMPNDTDFSVSMRAEVPGIDFAFAGERNHYHTPNDNLINLDLRTLQHHGENVLPLARTLASVDLNDFEDSNLVFSNVYGQWVSWEEGLSIYLVVFAAILLLIAGIKSGCRVPRLLLGLVSPLIYIVCCGLFLFLNFKLIEMVNGTTVSWPANDLPFRLVLFSAPAFVGFSLAAFLNRFIDREEALIGLWGFWLILAFGFALTLPAAVNLLVLPLVVASILMFAALWVPASVRPSIQLLTLVFVIPSSLGLVLTLEETQGYRLIVTTFFGLGLFFASIAPFVQGMLVRQSIIVVFFLAAFGSIVAVNQPLYSEWRPQHLNLHFIQDVDKNTAYWHAQTQHPLPEKLTSVTEFSQSLPVYAWSDTAIDNVSETETVDVNSPDLTIHKKGQSEHGYSVEVSISTNRGADWLTLVLPRSSNLLSYELGNEIYDANLVKKGFSEDNYVLVFHGIQNKQVDLTLNFEGSDTYSGYLLDVSGELPGSAEMLLKARRPLATPVHRGDQFILVQKVTL